MHSLNMKSEQNYPLAVLLGWQEIPQEYDVVFSTTSKSLKLLNNWMGADWVDSYLPGQIRNELKIKIEASPRRQSDKSGQHRLYGAGFPATYSSMALDESKEPGWLILQTMILGGLLIHNRRNKDLAKSHLISIGQFLTGLYGNIAKSQSQRSINQKFISGFREGSSLQDILNHLALYRGSLKKDITKAIEKVIDVLQKKRLNHPGGGVTHGPVIYAPSKPTNNILRNPNIHAYLGPGTPITDEVKADAIINAEAESEQTSAVLSIVPDAMPESGYLQRKVYAKKLILNLRQSLWAREQWDVLVEQEMQSMVKRWTSVFEIAMENGDWIRAEAALLTLICGCTGWSDKQVWSLPFANTVLNVPQGHTRAVLLDSGEIMFPVPCIGSRYSPVKNGKAHLVKVVSEQVRLTLPNSMIGMIRQLIKTNSFKAYGYFENNIADIQAVIQTFQGNTRDEEPRETTARLRNAHMLGLLKIGQDLPLAQLSSGELFSNNDVGLSYFAVPSRQLQELSNKVWIVHGYGETISSTENRLVGGSQLQILDETADKYIKKIRKNLIKPSQYKKELRHRSKIELQAEFAKSMAFMIMALTGLRPTLQIGTMTINQFSLRGKCAVFAEKVVDVGHMGRVVPLCPALCQSIQSYGKHLSNVSIDQGFSSNIREAARRALEGTGPLLFVIDKDNVRGLSLDDLRSKIPKNYHLPLNLFRHRLASKLRETECPGVYIEALLGHIELGIQPFGSESFMKPNEYIDFMANQIEKLAIKDGWGVLHGLPAPNDSDPWSPKSLDVWVLDIYESHQKAISEKQNNHLKLLDQYRNKCWDEILSKIDDALETSSPGFAVIKNGTLTKEHIDNIRFEIVKQSSNQAETQVSIEALRRRLSLARDDRNWTVHRLPFYFGSLPEPAPFSSDYPAVFESFLQLREYFIDVLNNKINYKPGNLSKRAVLVLALILWHGVCDWKRLNSILKNIHRGQLVDGLDDALAIPIADEGQDSDDLDNTDNQNLDTVEILRGTVAFAASEYVELGLTIKATMSQLGGEIEVCMPTGICSASKHEIIPVLLEAAKITHYFEHAPPIRDVWTGKVASTSISLSRINRLYSEKLIVPIEDDSAKRREATKPSKEVSFTKGKSENEIRMYTLLRNVLRVKSGSYKWLPIRNIELPQGTNASKIRKEIASELEFYLEKCTDAGFVYELLAGYAKYLLSGNTMSGKNIEANTIYAYVVHVGSALLKTNPGICLLQLEREDIQSAYEDAVNNAKGNYKVWVAKYISYFHMYLVHTYQVDSVDLRGLGGLIAGRPDVGIVTPKEYQASMSLLANPPPKHKSVSIVELKEAQGDFQLSYATGARSAEITMRQRRDLLSQDGLILAIKKNQFSRVKSKRANRLVNLKGYLNANEFIDIRNDGVFNDDQIYSRSPLFPDPENPKVPINMDFSSGIIGSVLRSVTNEDSAKKYWLRHNSASMEFLHLFADDKVIKQIKYDKNIKVPFPLGYTARKSAELLAGNGYLSQIHASAFKARRGHALIETSLTSYIHIIPLIESEASRESLSKLTNKGIARLTGKSEEWVRQIAHRKGISLKEGDKLRDLVLKHLIENENEVVRTPLDKYILDKRFIRPVSINSVYRCVNSYFQSGDLSVAVKRLGSTDESRKIVAAFLEALPVKPSIVAENLTKSKKSLLVADIKSTIQSVELGDRKVPKADIMALLEGMKSSVSGQYNAIWEKVLLGADLADGVIRVDNVADLVKLYTGLSEILRSSLNSRRVVLVIPTSSEIQVFRAELASLPELSEAEIIKRQMKVRVKNYIPATISVISEKGQLKLLTLVIAAVTWKIWYQLKQI